MNFKFRRQTQTVASLLQVCSGVLVNLTGQDKEQMEVALRKFEDVATAMEINVEQIIKAAHGVKLAKSELRAVVDLAASSITSGATLEAKLQSMVEKVTTLRPVAGDAVVTELCSSPGRAWVAIHMQADKSCQITAWDGSSRQPSIEVREDYASARDRADELADEIHAKRGKTLGSTGEQAWIVVPVAGAMSDHVIDQRSGVVAKRKGDQVAVYYEGNRMGADNLNRYAERVTNAAGRLFKRYPTVARSAYSLSDFLTQFQIVGFCTDAYEIHIHDMGAVLAYVGTPGMNIPSVEGDSYQMNDRGEWKKGDVLADRSEVAKVHVLPTRELMLAI